MKLNTPTAPLRTHEGATAKHINPEQQLRRSVMACMLWEGEFYEDGQAIAQRICDAIKSVKPEVVEAIAVEAREKMKLRHVPLLIVREMARLPSHRHLVAATLAAVIQRPDELAEFLAIYWKEKKQPLSAQVKRGLAAAFQKFNAYSLAKYNRDGAIKLRDVLFLCHAKPKDEEQDATWKQLIAGTLSSPDTWEVALSSGADKKTTWERLIAEDKLGALALLRNLRNMTQAGVAESTVRAALSAMKPERVLPYRFIAAARYAPQFEPELEAAMLKCVADRDKLPGTTTLLVDVSGSMDSAISTKSDLRRVDAACGLAMLLREIGQTVNVWTFSNQLVRVPARRGFALRDAIAASQPYGGTHLGSALRTLQANEAKPDRLIVITDEQSTDKVPDPQCKGYVVNVASNKNGVGYGPWTHVDGWSEAVVDYIKTLET
jgi:60 kDa SS-A/Ro ribonucleoprotein